jgi:hypothetical protein
MPFAINEDAYHGSRKSLNPTPCAFEKAILARCVSCKLADRRLLAERETINCHEVKAQETCTRLRVALRANSAFALKITSGTDDLLPHNKEMKVQCGGLRGLQWAVNGSEEVANVHQLLSDALTRFGDIASLPYAIIVQSVSSFNIRQRNNT